jgi:hypothetical protein
MIKQEQIQQIESTLSQFTGSDTWTLHWTRKLMYTEGISYLVEVCGAHWLLDLIASYQGPPVASCDGLQFWRLEIGDDMIATLTCRKDKDVQPCVTQEIEFTDFPLKSVDILVGDSSSAPCAMLPREY